MNTGGKAMLSISVLSDSDSIHRNTRIAGDTRNSTDRPKREASVRSGLRPMAPCMDWDAIEASISGPLRLLPHIEQQQRQRDDDDEEDDHDGRGVADVVELEGLQIEEDS